MLLHILSDRQRTTLAVSTFLVLGLQAAVCVKAQTATNPTPKKPGTVRIGLQLPQNGLSGGDNLQDGEPVRQAQGMLLTGPTLETVKLQAILPDQAMAEAKQLECDYVLSETLTQQKSESSGRFGKLMNMRTMQAASSAAVFLPGASSAKQIGMMGAEVAQQQLATATKGVKANSDITLHYTLTSVQGQVTLDDSAKAHSKSNGENVMTPLLTEAATKIAAVAKPVAPAAAANDAPGAAANPGGVSSSSTAALRIYGNYDFVPGDKTVFIDDFANTQDGEFPEKWELVKGQGSVNQQAGFPAFILSSGDPARMKIRMTQASYLGKQFTLEFDLFGVDAQYGQSLYFNSSPSQENPSLVFRTSRAFFKAPGSEEVSGNYPDDIAGHNFVGRWHHIAIAYKEPQLKLYVDQYRVLYVPDIKSSLQALAFGGLAQTYAPVVFRNVRLATGGGANYVGKQFTEAKIVTHGINFDLDKATLRPESMGVLNQIAKLMTSDPALKFEIDGHTDNTGTPAHNLELSAQRAAAVKSQLMQMGIDGSRLTTNGLGDTKPLGPNDTAEGQANNRRVEFVRAS